MMIWNEVHWPRPLSAPPLIGLLTRLASDQQRGPLVWEARAEEGRIRYLVGADQHDLGETASLLRQFVPGISVTPLMTPRLEAERSGRIKIRQRSLSLNLEATEQMLPALLGALAAANGRGDVLVVQVILDRAVMPEATPSSIEDPTTSLWSKLVRGSRPATGELKSRLSSKLSEYRFRTLVRIGVSAGHPARRRLLVMRVLAAFRQLQSGGTHVDLVPDRPDAVDEGRLVMWLPLRLTPDEALSFLAWPHGDDELPGMPSLHPRLIAPPISFVALKERAFAVTTAPGPQIPIGISRNDSFRHTHILGPTGVGKSTLMLHLIKADIDAGLSVVLIDPKGDLAMDALAQIPEKRQRDVVVIDPTLSQPVGINPLAAAPDRAALATDGILAVFKGLFPTAFGPRTTDILHASLLTLGATPGSTLVQLPALLTDASFRRSLVANVYDPIGLGPFWAQWEAMSPGQQAEAIGPVMSRLRQFLLRPTLRAVLDQAAPRFKFDEIFTKRRVVIVSLNKGLIGAQSATLLGSLFVSHLWQRALAQAALSEQERRPVSVYIDEAQAFLHLDVDLGEALEQSRSLKVAWHLAHQHRRQMPSELMAGIDANTRNKIAFTLESADAKAMAAGSDVTAEDFIKLPPYGIYASLLSGGRQTGWISGQTLPPPNAISSPEVILGESQMRYGAEADSTAGSVTGTPELGGDIGEESFGRARKRGAL
ncbi:MAG: type IV secretory system conjugative DNA transfer family protein [Thermomicrobiales bacterium]|nr:type IV secretory system conjugative DNA transfer family protein [Thermomicrobiales bacterium]MCO5219170.1 type IV secretory system conjugative DNA transfer family protein [Thermomicrobiales bacterium]MCO5225858.1 type IV secretory system conjugative DNA transfer family protein [Thermomicrobiales bacterium]MCO5228072.1 type IV secretory system conjugative DNA transfer family protein [Thermomicrobiales bacterium]